MHAKPLVTLAALILLVATQASANPERWKSEWPKTNFEKTNIASWSEILSGGPPRDGIPALSDPQFIRIDDENGCPRWGPNQAPWSGLGQTRRGWGRGEK